MRKYNKTNWISRVQREQEAHGKRKRERTIDHRTWKRGSIFWLDDMKNIYLSFGFGSSFAFAPNQPRRRPMGVACNARLSTVFSALFCNVCVRAVAWATITKNTTEREEVIKTKAIEHHLQVSGRAMPKIKIKTVPNILTIMNARTRSRINMTIGRSCNIVVNALFCRVE